jgi:hypothetical protein
LSDVNDYLKYGYVKSVRAKNVLPRFSVTLLRVNSPAIRSKTVPPFTYHFF